MAKQLTDEELNLKRKARRRLIGAIALTLAVVAILPMVLDREPKPGGQDIDLRIPAPDKVGEFVPGKAVSEAALPLAASAAVVAPAQPAAVAEAAKTEPVKPDAASGVAVTGNSGAGIADKPQPVVAAQPEPKAPELKAPEPKVAEPKVVDKPADPESYVAQVGAYANQNTAKQEVDKLKKWGFKVYTEKADNKIRVRVGPYTEREKAEKVRQLLEKHGIHSVIMSAK